ncbi:E1 [Trichechus manatus latirostris papillomavirus 2]|uniref:Replication protein E1 n=1 Tax=Trichechus manatus latirostris papillomavirus 2 TaxID=1144379 RepID=H6UYR4_9PAPI|nr:E1 gene product [Trichechus manatus latirostris papillomavirus 2]AFA26597.1 E1 [Trichechus manatus latirostris papillomavirus 2]
MAAKKGRDLREGSGAAFILAEAECSEDDSVSEDVVDHACRASEQDFIDDAEVEEGTTQHLFSRKEAEEDRERLKVALKRKYRYRGGNEDEGGCRSGEGAETPPRNKRRILATLQNDSGVALSEDETASIDEVGTGSNASGSIAGNQENVPPANRPHRAPEELLRAANKKALILGKFKALYGVSFAELTRPFKSDKTCYGDWVLAVYGVNETLVESAKMLLQSHVQFMQLTHMAGEGCTMLLMLIRLKHHKSRETLLRLLRGILCVSEGQMMAEPPRTRSVPVALFFYKYTISALAYNFGEVPEWIRKQTQINHQNADEQKFDLSTMVQWAYDFDYTDECTIAYQYAQLADEDSNANAWLNSAAQAKYVKDCATMVKYYKNAEMRDMTMSGWIHARLEKIAGEGDWRVVVRYLRYEGVEFCVFLNALKHLLKGTPKKNCLCIWGPPDTGKSMLCMGLIRVLGGRVLSFANSKSQFWLQPLADTKVALIDDATGPCWDYMDTYLRNALDGNPICIDRKHRAPLQIKCPPIIITTNFDVKLTGRWPYLNSRVTSFKFEQPFPFIDADTPTFPLTDANLKAFFVKFWGQLELSEPEDEGDDGGAARTFKCGARRSVANI